MMMTRCQREMFTSRAPLLVMLFTSACGTANGSGDANSSISSDPAPLSGALTLTVNLSTTIRPVTHVASGSLYGVTETLPANVPGLVAPLNPKVFTNPARAGAGYKQPIGAGIPVAGRLTGTSGRVMLRLADICPNWPYTFPGTSSWLNQVSSVITDKKASGHSNFYGYEIWNEPVYTWNTANGSFNDFWKQTYDLIRAQDPGAKIIGPSDGYYDNTRMRDFLTYCKANSCLPDVVSWHELGPNGASTVSASINSLRALESSLGISNLPISINEYCDADHTHEGAPGPSAPFIAKFERLGVDNACISWWWTANPGRLGSLLASDSAKGGGWWFYHWYAAMSGSMVSVTPPNDASSQVDGFASVDARERYASIAFGGQNPGAVTAVINGIPSWFGGSIRAIVESVSWTDKDTPVYVTNLVSQAIKTVTNGSVSMSLTGLSSLYGYRILLLPSAASPTTVSSGHTYKLVNLNSGKVLGIKGMGTGDGALALQWGDNGTSDHNWKSTLVNGYYRLTNANSGKVLGIMNEATTDKALALQWSDNGTPDHDWTFTDTGSGVYKLTNRNSGKVLGVMDMGSLDGASAVQWSDTGTADQRWVLALVN